MEPAGGKDVGDFAYQADEETVACGKEKVPSGAPGDKMRMDGSLGDGLGLKPAGSFEFHLSCPVPAPSVVLPNVDDGGTGASSFWLLEGPLCTGLFL